MWGLSFFIWMLQKFQLANDRFVTDGSRFMFYNKQNLLKNYIIEKSLISADINCKRENEILNTGSRNNSINFNLYGFK